MSEAATPRGGGGGRRLPQLVRWLHVYASMFGLAATLLFAVTGLTLNHADWFESGEPTVRTIDGELPPAMVAGAVDALAVAEELRTRHGLQGRVGEFAVADDDCLVIWKGPGYSADATIARPSGKYRIDESRRTWLAILDDLHKGRDCGPGWGIVIDASAVVLAFLSGTGLWLLFYLKRRRRNGLLVALAGTVVVVVAYVALVP